MRKLRHVEHTQKVYVADPRYEERPSASKAHVLIPTLYHVLS